MKRMPGRRDKYGLCQIGLFLSLVTFYVSRTTAVDAAHAAAFANFRFYFTVAALAAIAILQQLKRRLPREPKQAADDRALMPAELAISVTYESTREANWRCNIYELTHHWQVLLFIAVLGISIASQFIAPIFKANRMWAYITVPLTVIGGLAAAATFVLFLTWLLLKSRFPSRSAMRICTSSLVEAGFHDKTPDGMKLLPWKQIKAIRLHVGDIYVWGDLGIGHFIPRSAFRDAEAARQFFLAAQTLWKSNGTAWPEEYRIPE